MSDEQNGQLDPDTLVELGERAAYVRADLIPMINGEQKKADEPDYPEETEEEKEKRLKQEGEDYTRLIGFGD